jgi:hypothetical protein
VAAAVAARLLPISDILCSVRLRRPCAAQRRAHCADGGAPRQHRAGSRKGERAGALVSTAAPRVVASVCVAEPETLAVDELQASQSPGAWLSLRRADASVTRRSEPTPANSSTAGSSAPGLSSDLDRSTPTALGGRSPSCARSPWRARPVTPTPSSGRCRCPRAQRAGGLPQLASARARRLSHHRATTARRRSGRTGRSQGR